VREAGYGPKPEWEACSGRIRNWGDSGHAGCMVGTAVLDPKPNSRSSREREPFNDWRLFAHIGTLAPDKALSAFQAPRAQCPRGRVILRGASKPTRRDIPVGFETPHQSEEKVPLMGFAICSAVSPEARFLGIVSAEFVTKELAVWSAPRLQLAVHDR
jgi:hypothetical protein